MAAGNLNGARLFGKLPSRGDFVRVNVGGPEALGMGDWLESALDVCRRLGCGLPKDPVRFVYCADDARDALVGTMRPSVDSVGRVFPLAIFASLPVAQAAASLAAIPQAYGPFLTAAATLADAAANLEMDELQARLAALPAVSTNQITAAARDVAAALAQTPASEHHAAVFANAAPPPQYYAYRTLALACEQARSAGRGAATVDFPCKDAVTATAWLGVLQQLAPRGLTPSLFWTEGSSSPSYGSVSVKLPSIAHRLLVALGSPPHVVLAYLAGAAADTPKIWPLLSDNSRALEAAQRALSDAQRKILDASDATLQSVANAFAH